MKRKLQIFKWIILLLVLNINCVKETIDPKFKRPKINRKQPIIIQPGVTAFRIDAPQPAKRIFELDENNSNPLTIVGEQLMPVVVKIKIKIDPGEKAKIIYCDYPKKSVGKDIEKIVKTWDSFDPCKQGIIKYLINIGSHEFKVDTRGLRKAPECIQDEIIDGVLGKVNNYFTTDYNAKLDF